MKEYKALLASFIEVGTFLLAAFGGFLKSVAPPAAVGASYPVGISSFIVLLLLLGISAVARNQQPTKTKKAWLAAGLGLSICAIVSGIVYPHVLDRYTFPQNADLQDRKICASDNFLTINARSYKKAHPEAAPDELEANLTDNDIWTRDGLDAAQSMLLVSYTGLVLSIAGAVFCLLEANVIVGTTGEGVSTK